MHPGARPTIRLEQKEKAQIGIFGRFFSEKCRTNEKSPKSHVGQPVIIHQSEAAKTRDEANRSYKRVFSHAVDRSLPTKSTDSKPEAELRSPWTTRSSEISREFGRAAGNGPIASYRCKMHAESRDRGWFIVTAVLDNLGRRSPRPESPRRRVRKPRGRRAVGSASQKFKKTSTPLYRKTS